MRRLSFSLLLLVCNSAWAEWAYMGRTDSLVAYTDLSSILRKRGSMVELWVLYDRRAENSDLESLIPIPPVPMPRRPDSDPSGVYQSRQVRFQIDCGGQRARLIYSAYFTESMGGGHVLLRTNKPGKWTSVGRPTGVDENIWNVACLVDLTPLPSETWTHVRRENLVEKPPDSFQPFPDFGRLFDDFFDHSLRIPMVSYVDLSTIRRHGNIVKMWSLSDTKDWSEKMLHEFDCEEERTRSLYRALYQASMGKGQIANVDIRPLNWEPVAHGSFVETLWKIACNGANAPSRGGQTIDGEQGEKQETHASSILSTQVFVYRF